MAPGLTGSPYPYGLREVKIVVGATEVSFDAAQQLNWRITTSTAELRGNDRVVVTSTVEEAVEFDFSAGGIPTEAIALMTGRTVSTAGTTPNIIDTFTGTAGDVYPYFVMYGKSVGDDGDDVYVKFYKCKLTEAPQGVQQDQQFFITQLRGRAIGDSGASNKIYDIVHRETEAALP